MTKNIWSYWRPIYRYTWAIAQLSSYGHFRASTSSGNKLVLDIGTGTGEYIKNLPTDNRYIFTDIDPVSLAIAGRHAREHLREGSYELVVCDAFAALRDHGDADIVSFIHVISVVADPGELIRTAKERLKPGGTLLIYISRISKKIDWLCNPLVRSLGFRLLDLRKLTDGLLRKRIGILNDCYVYRKPL
jgi:SAM-dependent methyltransferase